MTFQDLQLIAPLLKAVAEEGYTTPSPIQQKAIPPVMAGRDLVGCAQTGTGKTAAFALPILQRLCAQPLGLGKRPIQAYGRHTRLRCSVLFGGVSQNPQVEALARGVDILIATPGRLNDLIGQGYVHLDDVQTFVLDEADRMLDMGLSTTSSG